MYDTQTEKTTHLVNLRKGKPRDSSYGCAVSFDRGGKVIALGSSDGKLKLYDVEREQQIRDIKCHGGRTTSVCWNKSILVPYLISTAGKDAVINHHDIR